MMMMMEPTDIWIISVSRAWDLTQSNLQCCGFMMPDTKDLVSHSWQMWRYNPMVNPSVDTLMVPRSGTDRVVKIYVKNAD